MAVCGTAITIKNRRHAAVCFLLHEPSSSSSSSSLLRDVSLHWGCVQKERGHWQAPPAGWHTYPDQSFDAGEGLSLTHLAALLV